MEQDIRVATSVRGLVAADESGEASAKMAAKGAEPTSPEGRVKAVIQPKSSPTLK